MTVSSIAQLLALEAAAKPCTLGAAAAPVGMLLPGASGHVTSRLMIDQPDPQAVTQDSQVDVIGTAPADASVRVNGEQAVVSADGRFARGVALAVGMNTVVVELTCADGLHEFATRYVVRKPVSE